LSAPGVSLRDITAETVRAICDLEPHAAQSGFVAPNAVSIAQAHFNPVAVFRAIYADEEPVGFIMWRPENDGASCFLWRFMGDGRHQGKGYGREAIALWLEGLRQEGYKLATLSLCACRWRAARLLSGARVSGHGRDPRQWRTADGAGAVGPRPGEAVPARP
jgi:diamine N-acetyltransferase